MLQTNKILIKILTKCLEYVEIFFVDLTIELLKNTNNNKHIIKLENGKQLSYKSIYVLSPLKLKTLKIYNEIVKAGQLDQLLVAY